MGREELFSQALSAGEFQQRLWRESWRDESVISKINVNILSGAISYVFDLIRLMWPSETHYICDYESVSDELENALCHVLKVMSLC